MKRHHHHQQHQHRLLIIFAFLCSYFHRAVASSSRGEDVPGDWLLGQVHTRTTLEKNQDGTISLTNGIATRIFAMTPNFYTSDYVMEASAVPDQGMRRSSVVRKIGPDAYITLNNHTYAIGGATNEGQHHGAYLNRSCLQLSDVNGSYFKFQSYRTSAPVANVPWTPGYRHAPNVSWPPAGLHLEVVFQSENLGGADISVSLHYEMYDGMPMLTKWITAHRVSSAKEDNDDVDVVVNSVVVERLAVNGPFAQFGSGHASAGSVPFEVSGSQSRLYVQTDQAHSTTVNWISDPDFSTSTDAGAVEPVVEVTYSEGPGVHLRDGVVFSSFRTIEMLMENYDVERQSLARRQIVRTLAPWTSENPIFFHLTNATSAGMRAAVDQMVEVGFDMLIYSFGSGFSFESENQTYVESVGADIAYAKSKGIEVGGYDLICLDRGHGGYGGNVGDAFDVVNPDGTLGPHACFASAWADKLENITFKWVKEMGLRMVETDGPYGGASCSATNHTHHEGIEDSVYQQTRIQASFYSKLRAENVFINQPDNFFFQGGQKTGMGYDENQYSLPRWEDLSVSRQTMFDDTYHFTPTQGWMFVPLVDYHGGGAAAAFEPLSDNLLEYEWALAQYLGYGTAACYRGPRLFDTDETKAVVKKWVDFYKAHRQILISDIVHLRRPDMQGIDAILHVNPKLETEVGLVMVYNPTTERVQEPLLVPLYYAGLDSSATVTRADGVTKQYGLDRHYTIALDLDMPPKSITWFSIERP